MPGGARKGCSKPAASGRRKGTPNKRTTMVNEQLDALGADPVAFLVATMLNDRKTLELPYGKDAPDIPFKYREDAARELMQYVAPKLKSIDFQNSDGSFAETFAAAVATFATVNKSKKKSRG